MAQISSSLLPCVPAVQLALVEARRLSLSASELENQARKQQCQGTDEKCRPGSRFAYLIGRASALGFGDNGL
jgi:hypothetical protein